MQFINKLRDLRDTFNQGINDGQLEAAKGFNQMAMSAGFKDGEVFDPNKMAYIVRRTLEKSPAMKDPANKDYIDAVVASTVAHLSGESLFKCWAIISAAQLKHPIQFVRFQNAVLEEERLERILRLKDWKFEIELKDPFEGLRG